MKTGVLATVSGLIGAAVGAVTTFFVTKHINDKMRDKEIQSVIDAFKDLDEPSEENKVQSMKNAGYGPEEIVKALNLEEKEAVKDTYEEIVANQDYVPEPPAAPIKYADKKPKVKKADRLFKPPYLIEDYEFEEENDYRKITLTYYADGKVVDEIGTIVEAETILGDNLKSFGDSDSLYVRNERLRCDYEVLKDGQYYSDIVEKKPYLADSDEDDD